MYFWTQISYILNIHRVRNGISFVGLGNGSNYPGLFGLGIHLYIKENCRHIYLVGLLMKQQNFLHVTYMYDMNFFLSQTIVEVKDQTINFRDDNSCPTTSTTFIYAWICVIYVCLDGMFLSYSRKEMSFLFDWSSSRCPFIKVFFFLFGMTQQFGQL